MSIFKTIGSKLKRVISINNIKRAATGNFSAIGADVIRVATTLSPAEQRAKDAGKSNTEQSFNVAPLSAEVNTVLNAQGTIFSEKLADQIASNKTTQDAVSFFTKIGKKAFWINNRNWIIGVAFALVLFIVGWKILKKGENVRRATRTR